MKYINLNQLNLNFQSSFADTINELNGKASDPSSIEAKGLALFSKYDSSVFRKVNDYLVQATAARENAAVFADMALDDDDGIIIDEEPEEIDDTPAKNGIKEFIGDITSHIRALENEISKTNKKDPRFESLERQKEMFTAYLATIEYNNAIDAGVEAIEEREKYLTKPNISVDAAKAFLGENGENYDEERVDLTYDVKIKMLDDCKELIDCEKLYPTADFMPLMEELEKERFEAAKALEKYPEIREHDAFIKDRDVKELYTTIMDAAEDDDEFVNGHKEGYYAYIRYQMAEAKMSILAKTHPDEYKDFHAKLQLQGMKEAPTNSISDLRNLSEKLDKTSKIGLNSTEYRKFRKELNAVINGKGDYAKLYETAQKYIDDKTAKGTKMPSSQSGKDRVEFVKRVMNIAGFYVKQNEVVDSAAKNTELGKNLDSNVENIEQERAGKTDFIKQALEEGKLAEKKLSKFFGKSNLTPEQQATAEELLMKACTAKFIQLEQNSEMGKNMINSLRFDESKFNDYVASCRMNINDTYFTSHEPINGNKISQILKTDPEDLLDNVSAGSSAKKSLDDEKMNALMALQKQGATRPEMADSIATLISCRYLEQKFKSGMNVQVSLEKFKKEIMSQPKFKATVDNLVASRDILLNEKSPDMAINKLISTMATTHVNPEDNKFEVNEQPAEIPDFVYDGN